MSSQYPGETAGYGNGTSGAYPTLDGPPQYEIEGMPVGEGQPMAQGEPVSGYPVDYGQSVQGQPVNGCQQPVNGYGQPVNGYGQQGVMVGQPVSGYNSAYPQMASPVAYGVQTTVVVASPLSVQQGADVPRFGGDWSDGICDCGSDCSSYCLACWCPCIRWAQTLERATLWTFGIACTIYLILRLSTELLQIQQYVDVEANPWVLYLYYVGYAGSILLIALCIVYRMKIRDKYRIQGNCCMDCLCHTFCNPCALAQEGRHVDRLTGRLPLPAGYRQQQPQGYL